MYVCLCTYIVPSWCIADWWRSGKADNESCSRGTVEPHRSRQGGLQRCSWAHSQHVHRQVQVLCRTHSVNGRAFWGLLLSSRIVRPSYFPVYSTYQESCFLVAYDFVGIAKSFSDASHCNRRYYCLSLSICLSVSDISTPSRSSCFTFKCEADHRVELNVCWNMVFRTIFFYNKWESFPAVINGCGRLDVKHLILLRKVKFYRCIFLDNSYVLFCALLLTGSLHDSCMMSVFTVDAVEKIYIDFRWRMNWLLFLFYIFCLSIGFLCFYCILSLGHM